MNETEPPPLYCHICGSLLSRGDQGFSTYELSCDTCLAAYHVRNGEATCVTPSFVGHGEAPVVVPLTELRHPDHIRHLED